MHRGSSADPLRPDAAVHRPGLRHAARDRSLLALRAFVARSDDRRLDRTVGSGLGLRVLFSALERAYVPAGSVDVEVAFVLRTAADRPRPWTLRLTSEHARAQAGAAEAPALRVMLTVADFVRMAAGVLDPGTALLMGRLNLEGDFELATRLGALFGLGRL